jgi:hypothetical protein
MTERADVKQTAARQVKRLETVADFAR